MSWRVDASLPMDTTIDKVEYLGSRLGGVNVLDAILPGLQETFRNEGLPSLKRDGRTGNTFTAHRLLTYARLHHGRATQAALKDAMFVQYFHHGNSVNEREVLLAAAKSAGMDAEAAAAVISNDDACRNEVLAELDWAMREGVKSVPHFRIGSHPPFEDSDADFEKILRSLV
mmetsp:Transcript_48420/g.156919  ORF Transcript_48420/g.156919 Transcript_48420/m.156919 type:complete len:172 (+) Transcript_48420:184-699(+)